MKRRKFLQSLAWIAGGSVISSYAPVQKFIRGKKIRGTLTCKGRGVPNVVVSDGYSLVLTDSNGHYEITPHHDAVTIFVSTPPGYEFIHQNGVARHYRLIKNVGRKGRVDFELTQLPKDDHEHHFIIWADPQVKNQSDVRKMMEQSVPDVRRIVEETGTHELIHGITVGDIVWDELQLFGEYDKAVAQMNIPFFQCLGNHDMDYRKGGDETSDDTFTDTYGPTYYSFNRGKVHYVVLDNVRYLGTERDYDGFVQQHQLDWLRKDLSFVPEDRLIVLCLHIPVHSGTKNKEALYEVIADRKVHIMSGHTHYNVNVEQGNIYEHNHGTVCGAWWTGPICEDGTPCGYGVYHVKGTELSWHYQSTGKSSTHQMHLFPSSMPSGEKNIVVNIWNHDEAWQTRYWVDGKEMGALQKFEGFDPDAYKSMLGPTLPNPRGFAEPKKTKHLFQATLPANATNIKVSAVDRFGREYEEFLQLTA